MDEQKAREIADKNERFYGGEYESFNECYKSAMEMAEWKNQQMIEYLYENIQSLLKDYGVSEASADLATQLFLANFKQTMKGK